LEGQTNNTQCMHNPETSRPLSTASANPSSDSPATNQNQVSKKARLN